MNFLSWEIEETSSEFEEFSQENKAIAKLKSYLEEKRKGIGNGKQGTENLQHF